VLLVEQVEQAELVVLVVLVLAEQLLIRSVTTGPTPLLLLTKLNSNLQFRENRNPLTLSAGFLHSKFSVRLVTVFSIGPIL